MSWDKGYCLDCHGECGAPRTLPKNEEEMSEVVEQHLEAAEKKGYERAKSEPGLIEGLVYGAGQFNGFLAKARKEGRIAGLREAVELSRSHSHRDMAGNEVGYDECSCEDRIADDIERRAEEVERE